MKKPIDLTAQELRDITENGLVDEKTHKAVEKIMDAALEAASKFRVRAIDWGHITPEVKKVLEKKGLKVETHFYRNEHTSTISW